MNRLYAYSLLFVMLIIFSACEEIGEEEKRKGEIINVTELTAHPWRINTFTTDDVLVDMYLVFKEDYSLHIINQEGDGMAGKWAVSDDETLLVIRMDEQIPPYDLLDDEWVVLSQTSNNIRIVVQIVSSTKEFRCEAATDNDLPKKDDDEDDDDNDNDDEDDDDDDNDDDDGD